MAIINIQAAKTHLSRLVEQAARGEEIILAKAGKPMVKLVPISPARPPRKLGQLADQGYGEAPGCWDQNSYDLLKDAVEGPLFHGAVEEPPALPPAPATAQPAPPPAKP